MAFHSTRADIGRGMTAQADQWPEARRRDFIVNAVMKKLDNAAVEERYGETGWAPNRGMIRKETNAFSLAARGGR